MADAFAINPFSLTDFDFGAPTAATDTYIEDPGVNDVRGSATSRIWLWKIRETLRSRQLRTSLALVAHAETDTVSTSGDVAEWIQDILIESFSIERNAPRSEALFQRPQTSMRILLLLLEALSFFPKHTQPYALPTGEQVIDLLTHNGRVTCILGENYFQLLTDRGGDIDQVVLGVDDYTITNVRRAIEESITARVQ